MEGSSSESPAPEGLGFCIPARVAIQSSLPDFPKRPTLRYAAHIQSHALTFFPRCSIEKQRSHGILTVCPSPAAFAIGLGPTNPWLIDIAKETLVFRRPPFSGGLRLLVPTFSLPYAPVRLASGLHRGMECSPTTARVSLSLITCSND